jgi:flagellar biosynthesis protein FliP
MVTAAGAQDVSINFPQGTGLTERVIQMIALLTVLSPAPSILVMMTSFTRIVVVLSLLRTALATSIFEMPTVCKTPRLRSIFSKRRCASAHCPCRA